MYAFAVALLALVALSTATTLQFIDDFSYPTSEFGIFSGDFSGAIPCSASSPCTKSSVVCDPSPASSNGHITGGTREVKIVGFPTPSCSITAVVFNGSFAGSVGGISCSATVTTRYDGKTNCALQNEAAQGGARGAGYPGQFTEDFNLGINLLQEAFAFQILARADHPVPLRLTVYQSSSSKATVTQTITTVQNQVNPFNTYQFLFTQFNNNNVLSNCGAIDFAFDINDNIQCELAELDVLVPDTASLCGTVFTDCNCNLVQDTGDASISGVAVSLSGAATSSTTTGSNGGYCFTGLTTGVTYSVSVPGNLGLCSNSGNSNPRTINLAQGGASGVNFAVTGAGGSLQVPPAITVPCGSSTDPSATGQASVGSGACGGSGTVTFSDSVSQGTCSSNGVISTITRTWSGAGTSQSQIITVTDTRRAPTLTVPAATTVACGGSTDPSSTGQATAVQNGCTVVSVSFTDSGSGSGNCDINTCTRASSFVRTWTAVDQCGNAASPQTQTINIGQCTSTCPACPTCPPPVTIPVTVPVTQAPKPVVGPLNCKFICDDADSSASAVVSSLVALLLVVLAMF